MEIKKRIAGKTYDGENILEYSLMNDSGCHVSILNLGGIITEICVPDKNNKIENVVLGYSNIEDYQQNPPFLGALVGRIAGRVSGAQFTIDDETYLLEKNNNSSNLHGGPKGFDKFIWDVKEIYQDNSIALEFNRLSPDKEMGFPGNLNVTVTYTFDNSNNLEINYFATTDKKTIITLTNHSYFNLSGNLKENILSHILKIDADKFGAVTDEVLPTGEFVNVEGTAFDFRNGKLVSQDIYSKEQQIKNGGGYDHPFFLNTSSDSPISLYDEKSGRILNVTTDQPAVVLYTANFLGTDLELQNNKKSCNYLGLCLETQYYPDAINKESFPTYILAPGDVYKAKTKFSFSTK
ncbi:aldose epimerase family protein [Clostridium grantii]|uniref:Aldose 1-epimerase n=1 Tax=Clostridium grantii DSM 8605 TaxID=1121316 RepID=A0A1M5UCE9_9CLOT|nr:aldose epimerase family protein [Clostridium grantii]SHH60725.1 aldose 1-epimerase [Clostridium grantii DSM 8605]